MPKYSISHAKILVALVLSASNSVHAVRLDGLAGLDFAEKYAFSTNRSAVIGTLRPETMAWWTYSILDAQTEGRLDDAQTLIDRWSSVPGLDKDSLKQKDQFERRQKILRFCEDPENGNIDDLAEGIRDLWRTSFIRPRKTPLSPDAFPDKVDPKDISFAAFWKKAGQDAKNLKEGFEHIAFADATSRNQSSLLFREGVLPDTPGFIDAAAAYLKNQSNPARFFSSSAFRKMTPAALEKLAEMLEGSKCNPWDSETFARETLSRISLPADSDKSDPAALRDVLEKRLAFARRLSPSLVQIKRECMENLLLFRMSHEDVPPSGLVKEYLETSRSLDELTPDWRNRVLDALVKIKISGGNMIPFVGMIDRAQFERVLAVADLLGGVSVPESNTSVLDEKEFEELSSRVELEWCASNPRIFAADQDVSLSIDVKGVDRMEVAIYELDSFAACRNAPDGKIDPALDLDCAVPNYRKTVSFDAVPSIVRHRETLELPELSMPGTYFVECSGGGVSSRALVRKGRLRTAVRQTGSGSVFVALDENGQTVKNAKVAIGPSVFEADENGEVFVPFAASNAESVDTTAIVCAGRLAAAVPGFVRPVETPRLEAAVAMDRETLAGEGRAVVLIRPALYVSGERISLSFLEHPEIEIVFEDAAGRKSVQTSSGMELSDTSETEVGFDVPSGVSSFSVSLSGNYKKASTGEIVRLETEKKISSVNGILKTPAIEQLVMRKSSGGYMIECRGRTGEPLTNRVFQFAFRHVAFKDNVEIATTLQVDENGIIRLGDLDGISTVQSDAYVWKISEDASSLFPETIATAEGEAIRLPLRLEDCGHWPGWDNLPSRASLMELDASGNIRSYCNAACFCSNSVLSIEGLPPGDYALKLRSNPGSTLIKVLRGGKRVAQAGLLAGDSRFETIISSPEPVRIDSVSERADENMLSVKLSGFSPEARVHVFARRTMAVTAEDLHPEMELWKMVEKPTRIESKPWADAASCYISGRKLGDALKYIMERRQSPARIGNMLPKPSMLSRPWSVSETTTRDIADKNGDGWIEDENEDLAIEMLKADAVEDAIAGDGRMNSGQFGNAGNAMSSRICLDFLPSPAAVVSNLRPDASGTVEIDLQLLEGRQDIVVVAVDNSSVDSVRYLREDVQFVPRDLRTPSAASAGIKGTVKKYQSLREVFLLLQSISSDPDFEKYSFLCEWNRKTPEEKQDLYSRHACHELDLFLHAKDPEFFASTVRPILADKRRPSFLDRYLLGEGLEEFAKPSRFAELNAFERCLLAIRVPSAAPAIARIMSDECGGMRFDPVEDNRRLSIALGEMFRQPVPVSKMGVVKFAPMASAPLMKSIAGPPSTSAAYSAGSRMQADLKRRAASRRYSPPGKTKEWVETGYKGKRPSEDVSGIAKTNRFWRDCASAAAEGRIGSFASPWAIDAAGSFPERMAALSALSVGFSPGEGVPVEFSRGDVPDPEGDEGNGDISIVQRIVEYSDDIDNSSAVEATGPFTSGRRYVLETVAVNHTAENRLVRIVSRIPSGAIALSSGEAVSDKVREIRPFSAETERCVFYFPYADPSAGKMPPAIAITSGKIAGCGTGFSRQVECLTQTSAADGWEAVSQNGTEEEILAFLEKTNLSKVDLAAMAWRMSDPAFAAKAFQILESRGAYSLTLSLCGLKWKDSFDLERVKEALSRASSVRALAPALGPAFESSVVQIDPEKANLFEHREYWPVINARAHGGGSTVSIPNQSLAKEYKTFLDILAAKKSLSADDRLLAAVYLVAQDRIAEAKAVAAEALQSAARPTLQSDYLETYFAFCDGRIEEARQIAERHLDAPAGIWRERFAEAAAQAREIAGERAVADRDASSAAAGGAPSLSIRAVMSGGIVDSLAVSSKNLSSCNIRAYPVDAEISFTKNPFESASGADSAFCLMPAWECETVLDDKTEALIAVPEKFKRTRLAVVASGASGGVESRIDVSPCSMDVQVVKDCGIIRVRDSAGAPVPGAYVKVYTSSIAEERFHKDGYTDLRGVFDYASVSTDLVSKPQKYAVFVTSPALGSKTVTIK